MKQPRVGRGNFPPVDVNRDVRPGDPDYEYYVEMEQTQNHPKAYVVNPDEIKYEFKMEGGLDYKPERLIITSWMLSVALFFVVVGGIFYLFGGFDAVDAWKAQYSGDTLWTVGVLFITAAIVFFGIALGRSFK